MTNFTKIVPDSRVSVPAVVAAFSGNQHETFYLAESIFEVKAKLPEVT